MPCCRVRTSRERSLSTRVLRWLGNTTTKVSLGSLNSFFVITFGLLVWVYSGDSVSGLGTTELPE